MEQHRFGPGPLLDGQGNLCEPGYATALLKTYDRNAIKAGRSRIKEWDYYLITNDRFGVALTIDDNGYMGLLSASVLDFDQRTETTVSPMFWLPMGKTGFPASSASGDVRKTLKNASGAFEHTNEGRRLRFSIDKFRDGLPFTCDITLFDEPRDSMVIATPFEKKGHFYYNQKIVGMRAKGFFAVGDARTELNPKETFGLLDWGRGVWTYKNRAKRTVMCSASISDTASETRVRQAKTCCFTTGSHTSSDASISESRRERTDRTTCLHRGISPTMKDGLTSCSCRSSTARQRQTCSSSAPISIRCSADFPAR